jgi:hypothetical protein
VHLSVQVQCRSTSFRRHHSFLSLLLCKWRTSIPRLRYRVPRTVLRLCPVIHILASITISTSVCGDSRRIWPIGPTALGIIWPRGRALPRPNPNLHDLVCGGWLIDQIAHPRMPTRLDLRGVQLLGLVVYPACAQRKLFFQVFEEFVAPAVSAD